ncbi:MAG: ABC transporter permease subunit [Lachnospiraceae bacterium]|nr:ABC transporter permease subunit [Lachnospiraceae bacterium]
MFAIIKKELRQYFYSMVGFVFLAFFLALIGLYTWAGNLAQGIGNFELTLGNLTFIYVILIPILTMRIVAEENKQRTDQLLYTSPISLSKIILGKYLAVMTLFTIAILVIALYPLLINMYGRDVRLSLAYSSLIGFYLLGAANIAIGLFISSLTESQVIAAVVSFIALLMSNMLTSIASMLPGDSLSQAIIMAVLWLVVCTIAYNMMKNVTVTVVLALVGEAVVWGIYIAKSALYENLLTKVSGVFAITGRYSDFELGILDYDAIIYYLSVSFLFLFLTVQMIKKKRFN